MNIQARIEGAEPETTPRQTPMEELHYRLVDLCSLTEMVAYINTQGIQKDVQEGLATLAVYINRETQDITDLLEELQRHVGPKQ